MPRRSWKTLRGNPSVRHPHPDAPEPEVASASGPEGAGKGRAARGLASRPSSPSLSPGSVIDAPSPAPRPSPAGGGGPCWGRTRPPGRSRGWEARIAMATSSSRGNTELLNVPQIGKGPAECQLRLQAGGGRAVSAGRRGATEPGCWAARVSSESTGATHAGHVTRAAGPPTPHPGPAGSGSADWLRAAAPSVGRLRRTPPSWGSAPVP
ncbi:homeobox protein engrailed-2-like [Eschrichtius robustus]|uniref:homeobox protein engrailed-2-like n=1 Tax=Eschrichtius robustus TaxID=9764 RepID=UPI0035C1E282